MVIVTHESYDSVLVGTGKLVCVCYCVGRQAQFEIISSEVSYLKSMNILVGHFMANLGANFDRDRESIMTRDDYNRLFSNARAVRDASVKLVVAHFQSCCC